MAFEVRHCGPFLGTQKGPKIRFVHSTVVYTGIRLGSLFWNLKTGFFFGGWKRKCGDKLEIIVAFISGSLGGSLVHQLGVIRGSIWGSFGVIWASSGDHFGGHSGLIWGLFAVSWGSSGVDVQLIGGSSGGHLGVMRRSAGRPSGSSVSHLEVIWRSSEDHLELLFGSFGNLAPCQKKVSEDMSLIPRDRQRVFCRTFRIFLGRSAGGHSSITWSSFGVQFEKVLTSFWELST